MTFPLASLSCPGLTLNEWRKTLKNSLHRDPNRLIIGIANAAGCIVAVLHWNGGGFDVLASAPSLMMDSGLIEQAALQTVSTLQRRTGEQG